MIDEVPSGGLGTSMESSKDKWLQTPYGYGESPNANFLSPSPFPTGITIFMETVKPNG